MKVIVISGSPRMDKGNTAVILAPFMEGMREAGAEVEVFYTKKLKIRPCQGEYSCWLKTPGVCFQHDDMDWLRPKLGEGDIHVIATPLYFDGMPGSLKNFIDRLTPGALPLIELRNGRCRHPLREGVAPKPLVLVSNCGFWEMANFDVLLAHMKAWAENANATFVGSLLRPHGPAMTAMLEAGAPVKDVLEAAKEAGRQLITEGEMSSQTLAVVSRPLIPQETYLQMVNQKFRQALAALSGHDLADVHST
jgi:multimeric flavodoxin WrbA